MVCRLTDVNVQKPDTRAPPRPPTPFGPHPVVNAMCTLGLAYLTTLALAKGVGGGPCFQADPGLLLEITRDRKGVH